MGWKEDFQREKEKLQAKEQEKAALKSERSETEKLAKTGNTVIKGIALWYLIPFFAIGAIAGIFILVWIWDTITGLF